MQCSVVIESERSQERFYEIQNTHPFKQTQFSGAIISKVRKLISWSRVPVTCRRTSSLVPRSADLDLESWFGCCTSCSSTAGIDKAWIVKNRSEVMQQKLSASHIASCIALNLYIIARLPPHTSDSTPVPCNLNLSVVWPCHVFFSIPYHQLSLKLRQQLMNPSQWTYTIRSNQGLKLRSQSFSFEGMYGSNYIVSWERLVHSGDYLGPAIASRGRGILMRF